MKRRDRRHWVAITVGFGLAVLGFLGLLLALHEWSNGQHTRYVGRLLLVSALVAPIFTFLAVSELVWRLRNGPQQPGRHARDD